MARIMLNETSYHGAGCIAEIPGEITRRGLKKAFVCSDPDLIKFGITAKVTDLLDNAGIAYSIFSDIKPNPTIENVSQTNYKLFLLNIVFSLWILSIEISDLILTLSKDFCISNCIAVAMWNIALLCSIHPTISQP